MFKLMKSQILLMPAFWRPRLFKECILDSIRHTLGIAMIGLLTACASYPLIGAAPATSPPRIINDPADSAKRIWDHPSAFGPIPNSLLGKGQATCSALNVTDIQYKAIGFHPRAQNFQGQTFIEGGYYCIPQ